ncbi:MAG: VWA domain-containing protein [Candidatus Acidiferrales bacterium]
MKRAAEAATVLGFLIFAVCIVFAGSLRAQAQRKPGTIKIDVDLVDILATVIDSHGQPVADLAQDSFQLLEEGVPQKIIRFEAETNRPLDLALMIDTSMSAVAEMKFESEAAAHFIRQVVRPGDALSVFEFSDSVEQLASFSADVSKLQEAVRHIEPGAGTSMYDAVVLASQSLERRPPNRRRAIVLLTDAGETTSVSKFEDARRAAIASQALLYTIVIRIVKNENGRNTGGEHALITITDSTGGAFFTLDGYDQLQTMFDRIDRELRTQYLLGYYPSPTPPPGSLRHVEVKVKSGDTVRSRKEYFTAGSSQGTY